jgi:signal peptidase I
MRDLIRWLVSSLILAVTVFFTLHLAMESYSVKSESMEPGLQIGERILISKMAYHFNEPERGEIVYFRSPDGGFNELERIIGIPGDIIEIKDNAVYVNNVKLTEPYVKYTSQYRVLTYQVPAKNYFILGDNRKSSIGSSIGWTVHRENILGRAWIFAWPPDRWGAVDNYSLD